MLFSIIDIEKKQVTHKATKRPNTAIELYLLCVLGPIPYDLKPRIDSGPPRKNLKQRKWFPKYLGAIVRTSVPLRLLGHTCTFDMCGILLHELVAVKETKRIRMY